MSGWYAVPPWYCREERTVSLLPVDFGCGCVERAPMGVRRVLGANTRKKWTIAEGAARRSRRAGDIVVDYGDAVFCFCSGLE